MALPETSLFTRNGVIGCRVSSMISGGTSERPIPIKELYLVGSTQFPLCLELFLLMKLLWRCSSHLYQQIAEIVALCRHHGIAVHSIGTFFDQEQSKRTAFLREL